MREILELCVELDRKAYDDYRALAQLCKEPELASIFNQMAREERTHVDWWSDLLIAWEAGLVPDIADEHNLFERLKELSVEVAALSPDSLPEMSTDDMLDLATSLEFYLLDPIFGELVDIMQPGSKVEVRDAYARHVVRLVDAIEKFYTRPGLSRFLAGVLRRAYRDQQRLAALAMRDQLTGLYNRRGLLGHLGQWLSWSERYKHPVGVALIDLDRFKEINDTLGHAGGDEALCAVSKVLRDTVRGSDVVGRFGGDEFLVLAPEADEEVLAQLMDRIVVAMSSEPLEVDGREIKLSVSVGGAWIPGGMGISPEVLIAQADRSMYAAKSEGRNRAGMPVEAAQLVS